MVDVNLGINVNYGYPCMFSSFEILFILYSFLCPKFMCNKRKLYDTFSKVSEESKIFTNAMSSKSKTKRKQ